MSGRSHPLGFCTCRTHVDRPWNRPAHWTTAEVAWLEARFGRSSLEAIAIHLGRTVVGVRIKAKRLGLRLRETGITEREAERLLGLPPGSHVLSRAARAGLIAFRRGWRQGPARVWVFTEPAIARFITDHGQYLDADRVPEDSPFAAAARINRWVPLPEVHRLTGRVPRSVVVGEIAAGTVRAARRGTHWYIRAEDVAAIRSLPPEWAEESWWRRQSVLSHRRARRKGIAA